MSTNIQIKKQCEHCGEFFMARKLVTRYCSHRCNSRAYKLKQRTERITATRDKIKEEFNEPAVPSRAESPAALVNIKQLSVIVGLGERTLFRLIKDEHFPKIKIGTRLLFNKDEVIHFINYKYKSV